MGIAAAGGAANRKEPRVRTRVPYSINLDPGIILYTSPLVRAGPGCVGELAAGA